MKVSRILPITAVALLASALAVPAATAATRELPPPTSTAAVSVTHTQHVPPLPQITALRVGRHATFDRLVFDVTGGLPSYTVRYVPSVIGNNGKPVPVKGKAILAVQMHSVDVTRPPTVPSIARLGAVRDIVVFDQFEGHLGWAVGVTGRNGFRVFELGNRIAVDIAHKVPKPTSTAPVAGSLGGTEKFAVVGVRAAGHPGYDRVVLDINGGGDYLVHYRGSALLVELKGASYLGPRTVPTGLRQVHTVRVAEQTTRGLTLQLVLRHSAGFRVIGLHNPSRIAVDVAH